MEFHKASRKQARARVAISGPAGAGKTYTALILAKQLANGGKVAVIDTERESASLYADEFDFDVLELDTFNPKFYQDAIEAAEREKYSVIIIDSMSHAWEGEGGFLDQKGKLEDTGKYNSWTAWRKVTPMHEKFVDAMLRSPCHMIVTLRAKMEYQQVEEGGRVSVKKVGLAPIARNGVEYEFTLFCDMDVDHSIYVSKSRCKPMADARDTLPGERFWKPFVEWLGKGEDYVEPEKHEPQEKPLDLRTIAGMKRPWPPEVVRHVLRAKAKQAAEKDNALLVIPDGTGGERGAMNGMLAARLEEDGRKKFIAVVWDQESSKKMSLAEIQTTLDYFQGKTEPEIIAAEMKELLADDRM